MKAHLLVPLVLGAVLAGTAAEAGTIFSQNFQGALGANESVGGRFTITDGQMGHVDYYRNNEYSYYQIALDLTDFEQISLQFDYDIVAEWRYDGFNLLASTDDVFDATTDLLTPTSPGFYNAMGNNLSRLGKTAATGEIAGLAVFDLSQFAGQKVNLRFQFQSDFAAFKPGVRLDNIKVTGQPVGAVPEPATWALLIGGFGMAGAALRRSRRLAVARGAAV